MAKRPKTGGQDDFDSDDPPARPDDDRSGAQLDAQRPHPLNNAAANQMPDPPVGPDDRRAQVRLRTTLTLPAGGAKVHMVDEFSEVGIAVTFPDGSNRPDAQDIATTRRHVKSADGEPPAGYRWDKRKFWRKLIEGRHGKAASPQMAIAIRHDTEQRVKDLAADLQNPHKAETDHTERVEAQRSDNKEPEQTPD